MRSRKLVLFGVSAAVLVVGLAVARRRGQHGEAGPGAEVTVEGRPFRLYTPPGLEGRASPLVLALHGGLGNSRDFSGRFPLFEEAAASGFRVAYLDGTLLGPPRGEHRTWNAGACCGSAQRKNIDDVGYLARVITELTARGQVTPGQIYLVGHSNGAMLAYRFACERGGLVRGVVGLAGVLVTPSCSGAAGVRVLHVHGQKDTLVPVEGGGAGEQLSGARFRSVEETVGALRAGGASVELLLVAGGEHGVPSLDAAARVERGAPLAALLGRFVRGEKVTDRP